MTDPTDAIEKAARELVEAEEAQRAFVEASALKNTPCRYLTAEQAAPFEALYHRTQRAQDAYRTALRDPAMLLALLARLREAERAKDSCPHPAPPWHDAGCPTGKELNAARWELNAAHAEIARLKRERDALR